MVEFRHLGFVYAVALAAGAPGCARKSQPPPGQSPEKAAQDMAEPAASTRRQDVPARSAPAALPPVPADDAKGGAVEKKAKARAKDEVSSTRQAEEAAAPAPAVGVQALTTQLASHRAGFERALLPDQLSCEGAEVHRKAICGIADQICGIADETPGLSSARTRCEEGRTHCQQANTKYRKSCQ